MRKGRSRMAAALLAVWAVTGCSAVLAGTHGESPAEGVTVLARIDGWREALTSDPDGTRVGHEVVVELAYDEATAREAWTGNVPDGLPARTGVPEEVGVYGNLGDVDLAQQAVVVYSSAQSGSCPGWLVDVSFVDGRLQVAETDSIPEGSNGCNDSRVPYRVVLAVDRDKLPPAEDLPIVRVRIDDRNTDGLVTGYPALPE
jgi:hypothetical protein